MSTLDYPDWWTKAEPELRATAANFVARLEVKLEEPAERIVKRKNPFLFRTKTNDAQEFVSALIDAFRSSSEETLFGKVLEEMAATICKYAKHGRKSGIEGIDLEYDENHNTRVLIQVKSGINWGNSSQHKALRNHFSKAARILKQGDSVKNVRCIEGCCYGTSKHEHKGHHERIVGLDFWHEISGWPDVSTAVMDVLGNVGQANLNDATQRAQERVTKYLKEQDILDANGTDIYWERLLELVLAPKRPRKSADDSTTAMLHA